jgi:hypoxanthine-DNA glycosylase
MNAGGPDAHIVAMALVEPAGRGHSYRPVFAPAAPCKAALLTRARSILSGFPPVVDGRSEILILGSFPSPRSLTKAQYYGHPQNQFWRLVGAVIEEPLSDMDYEERKRTLLSHRIALWDIIGACTRVGSLDANIRSPRHNNFAQVTHAAKKLQRVCFNGKTAAKMEPVFAAMRYETIVLPSSSPAYTLPFEQKLQAWRGILAAAPPGDSNRAPRPAASCPGPLASRRSC